MKRLSLLLTVLLISLVVFISCGEAVPAPAPAPAPAPVPAPAPTPAADQPQYGGTLRAITTALPANIGYMPTMASDGQQRSSMWAERLMDVDLKGDLVPCLAESWNTSPDGLTITFNLRKGVKFHDGTDFNADAVKWNYQLVWDAKILPDNQFLQSIDMVDPSTIKFTLNKPNSIMLMALWRPWMFSPTTTQTNGKEWAVTHPVSTGAFKVTEYQRDVLIKMEKNPNYWREGRPYLDGIELRLVKDPATCSMMMQSGQADMWIQATVQESADLRDKGFKVLTGVSTFNVLAPDSLNAGSPLADIKVREAVEYALDRPAIAKALGFGFAIPMDRLAPPNTAGYDANFKPRTYDVAHAKQLLADAGYPNGFGTTLLLMATGQNLGTVIQNYLNAVGIRVKLEVADSGKYYAAQQAQGWQGLLLTVVAISPEYSVAFTHHFSKTPDVKFVSLAKTDQFLALVDKTLQAKDTTSMRAATKEMVTQGAMDAMIIPITNNPVMTPVQENVHTTYTQVMYWTGWKICDDWLAKK